MLNPWLWSAYLTLDQEEKFDDPNSRRISKGNSSIAVDPSSGVYMGLSIEEEDVKDMKDELNINKIETLENETKNIDMKKDLFNKITIKKKGKKEWF